MEIIKDGLAIRALENDNLFNYEALWKGPIGTPSFPRESVLEMLVHIMNNPNPILIMWLSRYFHIKKDSFEYFYQFARRDTTALLSEVSRDHSMQDESDE